jgi:secreted trypsin-like serine protease
MRRIGILAGLVLLVLPLATYAAPANLLDKTVTYSVTTTASWIRADGKNGTSSRITTATVYISSAGRIFARTVRQDANAREDKKKAPGENTLHFVGDKLIGTNQHVSGAAQTTISFDPVGKSCTASVLFGRDSGRPMIWKGADGNTYTGTGPWVASNVTCSIASGNAFAGQ